MTGPISVIEGVQAAFGFLPRAWRSAALALGLATALICLYLGFEGRGAGGPAALALTPGVLVGVMAKGALYRLALAETAAGAPAGRIGPGGLQWGAVERRLLGMTLLLVLLLGFLLLLMLVALVAAAFGFASAGAGFVVSSPQSWREALQGTGGLIVLGLLTVGLMGFGWFALRLCLAAPATVARGRVQVLSAFGLTKGSVWRILASMLIVGLPLFAVVGLVATVFRGRPPAGLELWVCSLLYSLVGVFLYLPLMVGLLTYLYSRVGPAGAPVGAS
jgi:hypothetical protein